MTAMAETDKRLELWPFQTTRGIDTAHSLTELAGLKVVASPPVTQWDALTNFEKLSALEIIKSSLAGCGAIEITSDTFHHLFRPAAKAFLVGLGLVESNGIVRTIVEAEKLSDDARAFLTTLADYPEALPIGHSVKILTQAEQEARDAAKEKFRLSFSNASNHNSDQAEGALCDYNYDLAMPDCAPVAEIDSTPYDSDGATVDVIASDVSW